MMLQDKVAVIYGGAGQIGSAVARAFAEAGAQVHLAGVGNVAVFAASDHARMMTAATLNISGGSIIE